MLTLRSAQDGSFSRLKLRLASVLAAQGLDSLLLRRLLLMDVVVDNCSLLGYILLVDGLYAVIVRGRKTLDIRGSLETVERTLRRAEESILGLAVLSGVLLVLVDVWNHLEGRFRRRECVLESAVGGEALVSVVSGVAEIAKG